MCAGPGHARQAEAGERGLGSEIRRDCCCCLRAGGESGPLTRSHVRANLFNHAGNISILLGIFSQGGNS